MTHSTKIIADSISPAGVRLTTMEVTFPRLILSEVNTHRVFSRNSASSRAIPVEKMISYAMQNPFVPSRYSKNQKGMSAKEELSEVERELALQRWLRGRDWAVETTRSLLECGLHKEYANRPLETYMWHTALITSTEWDNFFNLRSNPTAHPEIRLMSDGMSAALQASQPRFVDYGDWHLPFITDEELQFNNQKYWLKVSVGRSARISYLTHDGKRDPDIDVALHDTLTGNGHMSPTEHQATPGYEDTFYGNFRGWQQYRKQIPGEANMLAHKAKMCSIIGPT